MSVPGQMGVDSGGVKGSMIAADKQRQQEGWAVNTQALLNDYNPFDQPIDPLQQQKMLIKGYAYLPRFHK